MKVVIKRVGQKPEVKDIPNELSALQEIVGGYIECVNLHNHNIICVCNEEGKLKGLTPNFILGNDIIVGDVFFCSSDKCDFNSLSNGEVSWLMNAFTMMEEN